MENFENLVEKQLDSHQIFSGKIMNVFVDDIELPDGHHATREYTTHWGAVCIVALTDDDKIIIERQYRYPVKRIIREIPAGKLDGPDEDPLVAAKRELMEETGITADHWSSLGQFIPAAAYSGEVITMYLATGLHYGERHLDEEEFLDVYEVPMESLVEDIFCGKISDGKTVAAVLKVYAMRNKE